MVDPDSGFTTFGPIGGVFVIGVGMLALGVPLVIACAVRLRAFFRGETLNEERQSWCRMRATCRQRSAGDATDGRAANFRPLTGF